MEVRKVHRGCSIAQHSTGLVLRGAKNNIFVYRYVSPRVASTRMAVLSRTKSLLLRRHLVQSMAYLSMAYLSIPSRRGAWDPGTRGWFNTCPSNPSTSTLLDQIQLFDTVLSWLHDFPPNVMLSVNMLSSVGVRVRSIFFFPLLLST